MTKDKIEELKESFDTLVELGIIFHYGSEEIEQGEITEIEFTEDDKGHWHMESVRLKDDQALPNTDTEENIISE